MKLRFECDQRWADFEGESASVRRCPQCDHMVHNLSAMTRAEARELFRSAESRLCVTYARRGSQVMFAEDLVKLESQRNGVRRLVRAAALVAPLLIAGCLDRPRSDADEPEIEVEVRFGDAGAASAQSSRSAYAAYARAHQQKNDAAERRQENPSFVEKLGDELERMTDELFGEEEQKFDQRAVVAGVAF